MADAGDGEWATRLADAEAQVRSLRELVRVDRDRHVADLALSLYNNGCFLERIGPPQRALEAFSESVELYRAFDGLERTGHHAVFGRALTAAGKWLGQLGRRDDALSMLREAVVVWRLLADRDRPRHLAGLADCLSYLALAHDKLNEAHAAELAAAEAVTHARELLASDRRRFLPDLARYLNNYARVLDLGQRAGSLAAVTEAVQLLRESSAGEQAEELRSLAVMQVNLSIRLSAANERADAVAAAREAIACYRTLNLQQEAPFYLDFVAALLQAGLRHGEAGLREAGQELLSECAAALLRVQPTNPYDWCEIARLLNNFLEGPQCLRDWLLPLARLLVEHRELAWDSGHAELFLELQHQLIERIWGLVTFWPEDEHALRDEAVGVLIAARQSPDLARWLDARAGAGGPLERLAELKRNVIEAEQLLAALRQGTPNGGGSSRAMISAGLGDEIEAQVIEARRAREAFRAERARLSAEDASFAAAFEVPDIATMRRIASHANGDALLCLLDIGADGNRRIVGVLLFVDGSPARCFELPRLREFLDDISGYEGQRVAELRGPLRGAAPATTNEVVDRSPLMPIVDLFAVGMSEWFWMPLRKALEASPSRVAQLHLCLNGIAQQLPLALRRASDCPGCDVVLWPGLPYLRFASLGAQGTCHGASDAGHWLVGHDCAWSSEQPLPMVAVEAALLRDLLQRHGRAARSIRTATRLDAPIRALVTCCHGGAERAQFDHALHLGQEPLTVRRIMQERIGPTLALLPACHAGRTDEDAAGNALGVAAAFMLAGTKVVSASSKAVPDLLQPWLSTLTIWHVVHGLPQHQAALRAREQFARLDFPEAYRSWLQTALPAALATIQPGGDEDPFIQGAKPQLALDIVAEHWPWAGDAEHLFSPDEALRASATLAVAQGVLTPRSEDRARAVSIMTREMAAFVFVYGVDTT